MDIFEDKLFKIGEIAEMLNTSTSNVRRLIRDQKLQALRVGSQWRVRKSEIFTYLEINKSHGFGSTGSK